MRWPPSGRVPNATFRVWSPLPRYVTKVLVARTARAVAITAMAVALGTTVTATPVARPRTETSTAAVRTPYRAPIDGSFGYVHGVLTQTAAGEPVEWQYPGRSPAPYAIIGANAWRDYTVSARVILPVGGTGSQGAGLIARFEGFRGSAVSQFRGYELRVRGNGAWQLVANGPAAVTLASGSVAGTRA